MRHLTTFQNRPSVSVDELSHVLGLNKMSQTSEIRGDLPSRSCCSAQKNRSAKQGHHLGVRQRHEDGKYVAGFKSNVGGQYHTLQKQGPHF